MICRQNKLIGRLIVQKRLISNRRHHLWIMSSQHNYSLHDKAVKKTNLSGRSSSTSSIRKFYKVKNINKLVIYGF